MFQNAERVHTALTANLEKRILSWIASRVPQAVGPDHLTALAFASQIFAGAAYAAASRDPRFLWLVNLFLALNWFGDSLDGTLARVRKRQRPRYGFYVDHIADTFGALALVCGLGCSGFVHWQVAAGLLVCFYTLSIEAYLATYTTGRFRLSHGFVGPTEIRILLAIGNTAISRNPCIQIAGGHFLLFDAGGVAAIAAMAAMALSAAARNTALLYRQETWR